MHQAAVINEAQQSTNNVPGQVAIAKTLPWFRDSKFEEKMLADIEEVNNTMYEGIKNLDLPIEPLKS